MKIHCLQHVSFENPGTLTDWAVMHQHSISYSYFFEKDYLLPSIDEFDVLLIMGGPMNVDEEDQFPWLTAEKIFIKAVIDAGKKVIGICLGAQLIAAALGSKVYAGKEKEIGFFPVEFSNMALKHPLLNHFSNPYTVFHWHGDTFELPENAQLIASTDVCKHQAYIIGSNVLAFQFHFEMNETVVEDMMLYDGHELEEEGKYIQTKSEVRNSFHYLHQNKQDLFLLLDQFFSA